MLGHSQAAVPAGVGDQALRNSEGSHRADVGRTEESRAETLTHAGNLPNSDEKDLETTREPSEEDLNAGPKGIQTSQPPMSSIQTFVVVLSICVRISFSVRGSRSLRVCLI